jgi:thiol-disulfide isomerase/thioredoxin
MKPALIALITLALLALLLIVSTKYKQRDGFADSIGETNERGTFTLYYADWCPHCKTIKPMFADFMGNGRVAVNNNYVRCKMVEEKQIQKGVDPDI